MFSTSDSGVGKLKEGSSGRSSEPSESTRGKGCGSGMGERDGGVQGERGLRSSVGCS